MAEKNSIQSFSEAHEIGKEFYRMQQEIDSLGVDAGYGMKTVSTPWEGIDKVDYFSQTYDGLDNQYYIRFQYFLWFLQDTIIPNIDFDPAIKLIKIDFWDVDKNLIYIVPGTLSSNPNVCMTKRGYYNVDWVDYLTTPAAETFQTEFPGTTSGALYGRIMNIYFNMFWILQQIDALKDSETGKISLYGLLDALCKGYNQATGNFNRLEPTVDTETNTIKIIDDVALPDRDLILKTYDLVPSSETALFDTYGYSYAPSDSVYGEGVPHASFIRDLSFNTSVTPNLATMITVGATNQGYVKGEDATALSRMNRGLTDRFKKQITNKDEDQDTSNAPLLPLEVQYAGAITAYNNYIKNIGCDTSEKIPTYDEDAVSDFQSLQTQLIEYYQARATIEGYTVDKTAASPNAGFLPFDLSLTMDGLSGMKVYQTFNIDSEFLPTNYPGTLLFLIKGITNKIENNQWTTTIESMCVAKNPFAASGSSNPVDEASRKTNRGYVSKTKGGTSRTIDGVVYKNGELPDNKLREINNAAKYKGQLSSDRTNPNDSKTGRIRLYEKASLALDKLIASAEAAGIPVKINSAYRTVPDQQRVYAENCPGGICKIPTATPGTSNHGFGVAVDFATPGLKRIKPGDKLYEWLIINGPSYGFNRIESESWHWEYQI
jgi:hypothetical protein